MTTKYPHLHSRRYVDPRHGAGARGVVAASLVACLLLLSACGSSSSKSASSTGGSRNLSAVLVSDQPVNDQGVMQSFVSGFTSGAKTYKYKVDRVIVLSDPSTYESTLQTVAPKYGIVITTFPPMDQAVSTVAPKYPKTHFVLLDAELSKPIPNVQELFFYVNQSSFLAGIVAGMMATQPKVGFLGGIVQNVINSYLIGYYYGVKYVKPTEKVCWSYVGNLEDPSLGYTDTLALYNKGIDIIHAATAGTEVGVYQASEKAHKFLIGADVSILPLDPTYGLTATGVDFSGAAQLLLKQQADGTFLTGLQTYGLKEGAVRIYPFNQKLVPKAVQTKVAQVTALIDAGKITVPGNNGVLPKSMKNC